MRIKMTLKNGELLKCIYLSLLFGKVSSCTSNTELYKRNGDEGTLQFQAQTVNAENAALAVVNLIISPVGGQLVNVLYINGISIKTSNCTGCTFTGNAAKGDLSVRIDNLQTSNAGTYKHAVNTKDNVLGCTSVYILGVPTKPTISRNKNPAIGESVILSCTSISTTTPSNHGLSLTYNWRVGNTVNPSSLRYTYSSNKRTLTLLNVVKEDSSKQFTCTATENDSQGYTSPSSDSLSLSVLYGPENLTFNPSDTTYTREENTTLSSVTCDAECNPTCTFKWTKIGQVSDISNSAVLSLGKLASSDAGTYRCAATRRETLTRTKDLTVSVIYGPRKMYFTPTDTSYRKDENFLLPSITCGSECLGCEYSWTGQNSYSHKGRVLSLGRLTRSMAGSYTCTARNIQSSQQTQQRNQVKIEVRYGPDTVSLSPQTTSYTVDEGSEINDIQCSADCFPACTYRWTKGQSTEVSQADTLSLGILEKQDTGRYTCTATNGDTPSKLLHRNITVTVRYGPYSSSTVLSPSTPEYTLNDGTFLSDITCSADCYPNCTYTWVKEHNGQTAVVKNGDILALGTLNSNDAADYTCTARNPEMANSLSTSKEVKINIRYGPDALYISVQSPYTVTEGEPIQDITCSSDCYPGCSISWKNETAGSSSSGGDLTLGTVNRYMAGLYTCTGRNTAREYAKMKEKNVTVIVLYTRVQSFYVLGRNEEKNVTVDEHDPFIQFNCIVESNTDSSVNIIFNGNAVSKQINGTFLSYFLRDVACTDAGVYTCETTNAYNRTNSNDFTLFVKCSPRPLRQIQRNITTELYNAVNLSFFAIAYPVPGPKGFSWHKKQDERWLPLLSNADLKISSSDLQSSLTVSNVSKEDFGQYRVTVTNEIARYEQYLFLSEKKDQQITCRENGTRKSDYLALTIGLTLGLVCCALAVYATCITFHFKRLKRQSGETSRKSASQITYSNPTFASDVNRGQRYVSSSAGGNESAASQYTDLSRYANTDKDAYDVISRP